MARRRSGVRGSKAIANFSLSYPSFCRILSGMTTTVRHLSSQRVAGIDPPEAQAWLAGRLAWEDRLAELEHGEHRQHLEHLRVATPRPTAARHWARTA